MSSSKPAGHQHRKKKYVFQERESPFPVPIASITRETESANYWYHYMGEIVGNQVQVKHSGDISYLQSMGFFGTGLLSRGPPTLYSDLPYVHIPTSETDVDIVHVMRKKMYIRHMKWRNMMNRQHNDSNTSNDCEDEFDSDVEYFPNESDQQFNHQTPSDDLYSHHSNTVTSSKPDTTSAPSKLCENNSSNHRTDNSDSWENNSTNQKSVINDSWNMVSSNEKASLDSWNTTSANQEAALNDWNTMEADEDFWSCEISEHSKQSSKDNSNQTKDNEEYINISKESACNEAKDATGENTCPPRKKLKLEENNDGHGVICNKENHVIGSCDSDNINKQQELKDSVPKACAIENDNEIDNEDKGPGFNSAKFENHIDSKDNDSDTVKHDKYKVSEKLDIINSDHKGIEEKVISEQTCDKLVDNSEKEPTHDKMSSLPLHSLCYNDDMTDIDTDNVSDYIVIDDSDIDDNTQPVEIKRSSAWQPVHKKEVFKFNEPLMLSLEEAFFLCYGLGCLTVLEETGVKLTINDMWCRFNSPQFLPKYVAYHYFRSKGWVPKLSSLFGTDLLVYKVGPTFYHASYSVIIKTIYEGTLEEVPGYNNRTLTWADFSGINRVTEHVSKMLVFCYVIMPADMSEEELSSPHCLSRFKVRLQLSSRWVSSQERDQQGKIVDID